MRYKTQPPRDFDAVQQSLDQLEDSDQVFTFRKVENFEPGSMELSNLFILEAMASRLTKVLDKSIHSVDLIYLIWLRGYEYVSRGYSVQQMKFLTMSSSYRFFQRNLENGLLREVRTRTIGLKNGSTYYLSKKGRDLANQVVEVLKNGL